ncbi:PrpF protein [Amanita muscaria]
MSFHPTVSRLIGQIPNPIPATFLRGGASKGIFLNRTHLPSSSSQWGPIFLGIMGSPDQYNRQLNGMGGGISSLSKICVVSEPNAELQKRPELGVQVEYTFAQISVQDETIDFSGNCGDLSAVVGAFALDEGICTVKSDNGLVTIRSFNTNTQKIIDTTFPITTASDGRIFSDLNKPEMSIGSVSGKASKIVMEFIDPSGARTGKLLPSGSPTNSVSVTIDGTSLHNVDVSLVDATNPTVFVRTSQLLSILPTLGPYLYSRTTDDQVDSVLESIRQQGARLMGLDPKAQAQPKIALVDISSSPQDAVDGVDVIVHALSMGVLHRAVPTTVGLCLGVAAQVEGSLVWDVVRKSREGRAQIREEDGDGMVRMKHPTGIVGVGAEMSDDGHVKSAKVLRTGRNLMKGGVWW